MIVRVILLFLIFMAVLAMFGRLRFPSVPGVKKCPRCGRPRIGSGPCSCERKG
jgi:hypothetical protein